MIQKVMEKSKIFYQVNISVIISIIISRVSALYTRTIRSGLIAIFLGILTCQTF